MDEWRYAFSNRRLPVQVFHIVAWCREWDIPLMKRFSIPAVEQGILPA